MKKKYRFVFTTDGRIRPGEIEGVMRVGLEERVNGFNKQRLGCQLVFWRMVDGPIQPPQSIDRYIQLFTNPKPLGTPLRLIAFYVKYFGVAFPYNGVRVVQDPAEIFCQRYNGGVHDVPIYIICNPQERTVTISIQIIESESLAVCRETFFTFQQRVEELLITAAAACNLSQNVLQS